MLGRWGGSSSLQLVMEDRLACNRYDAVPRERVVWSTHFLHIFSDENQYCFVFFFLIITLHRHPQWVRSLLNGEYQSVLPLYDLLTL